MKKSAFLFCILLPILANFPQEKAPDPQEPIKEYVSVTNVELILRIVQHGKALGGFKKEDFHLLENGKECRINGFFELRKKMIPEKKTEETAMSEPGRLFLLMFWSTQEQTEIEAHMDQFFKQIYQPNDCVILTGDQIQMEITAPEQVEPVRLDFRNRLKTEIGEKQKHWNILHRDISFEISRMIDLIRLNKDAGEVSRYLDDFTTRYGQFMKEVDILSQNVDFNQMEKMSESLRGIHSMKWVLLFFEPQRIPMVNIAGLKSEVEKAIICDDDGTMVSGWFKNLVEIEMNMAKMGNRYNLFEKLRSQFIQADTIFHFLMLDTPSTARMSKTDENDLISFKPVSSSWETIMKSISRITGGRVTDIKADPSALTPLFEQEDISYLITYVPGDSRSTDRKIELVLATPRPDLDKQNLIYGKRIELEKTPTVQIDRISHFQNALFVTCSNYYPIYTSKGTRGHLRVRVEGRLGKDESMELFNGDFEWSDTFVIPLKIEQSGTWEIKVEITDLMTRLVACTPYTLQYFIPDAKAESAESLFPKMSPILKRSASYCEKLKQTALRFFCTETVTEKIANTIRTNRHKKWKYDYQIVLKNGKISETRKEVEPDKKKKAAELKTLYQSLYSFFFPVTFLSEDRQSQYLYTFIEKDRMQKKETIHISAVPRNPASSLPGGELWIDVKDGSVLQIKLDPTTISGFKNRYELAKQKYLTLTITDIHQYFTRFNGMRFPTSTFISEQQTMTEFQGNIKLPRRYHRNRKRFNPTLYTVHFEYTDFRFFDINTDEKITGWVEE